MKDRILIVDDNEMMRTFLGTFLANHFDVYLAKDGMDAIEWLNNNELPKAIIADIDMPNMNGYTFLNVLMGNTTFSKIPVLMLSSPEAASDTRIKCYKLGAQDVVSKPFNPVELELKIEKYTHFKVL